MNFGVDQTLRRALFVVPASAAGGAERVLAVLGRDLIRRGWVVDVVSLARKTGSFFEEQLPGATIRYGNGAGGAGREWRLIPLVAGRREDLVVSSHIRMNAALSALRQAGILRCRRLVTRESTIPSHQADGLRLAAYRALYHFYGAQDLMVAQTDYMAEHVRALMPRGLRRRFAVLPNPVDIDAIRAEAAAPLPQLGAIARGDPILVWCGRMVAFKRPTVAVDVLAELHAMGRRDIRLLMIGDGPERASVETRIAARGVSEGVVLAGHLANPFPAMRKGTLGLITSAAFAEGFPNVLLEMMACGVPAVVTTACAGGVDKLAGVTVAGFESVELAGAVVAALGRGTDGEAARHTLAAHAIDSFVEAVVGDATHRAVV